MSSLIERNPQKKVHIRWKWNRASRYDKFCTQSLYEHDRSLEGDVENSEQQKQHPSHKGKLVSSEPEAAATNDMQDKIGKACIRCQKLDFKSMVEEVVNRYQNPPSSWDTTEELVDRPHISHELGTFESLVKDDRCSICDLFRQLAQMYAKYGRQTEKFYLCAFPTSVLYANKWGWNNIPDGVLSTVSFSIIDNADPDYGDDIKQPGSLRDIGCISPILEPDPFVDDHITLVRMPHPHDTFHARKIGEKLDVAIVKAWLNYCDYNHPGSCASTESSLNGCTKAIDCRTRSIVSLDPDSTYLALSYVWGGQEDYEAHKGNISVSFPPTISDAIELTHALGYNYLWVDRFCIVGDDAKERQMQIAQMDKIYAGAEATIIAAAGINPLHGLPGIRKRASGVQRYATINDQLYTVIPPDPAEEIKSSRWNSRAWTYQEAVLSKRKIIFCKQQVYFECSGMHCYEAVHSPLHLLHDPLALCFSKWNETGLYPVTKHRHALDQLFRHLSLYTSRSLSYPSDILSGMLGIFNAFSRQPVAAKSSRSDRQILQVAGIPLVPNDTLIEYNPVDPPIYHLSREEQFLTGLGWKLSKPAQRRKDFPSWSWTGWHGVVSPRNDYEGYIRNTHNLDLTFAVPGSPDLINLAAILRMFQKKTLAPGFLPRISATGTVVPVTVKIKDRYFWEEHLPRRLVAFLGSDNAEGYIQCDSFFPTYEDPRFVSDAYHEECIGLILGMAQCTYFAGNDKQTRVLDNSKFPLVIMVLHERDGLWERLGLIEHTVRVRTDECPIPVGSGYLELRMERRSLQLG